MSLIESMQKMKKEESEDRTLKVACDVLRTLVVLGGAGWEDELLEGLAGLAAAQDDLGSMASPQEVDKAVNILGEKGLIAYRKGKKADPIGSSITESTLYSLKDYTSALQVFGTDKAVLTLRG